MSLDLVKELSEGMKKTRLQVGSAAIAAHTSWKVGQWLCWIGEGCKLCLVEEGTEVVLAF